MEKIFLISSRINEIIKVIRWDNQISTFRNFNALINWLIDSGFSLLSRKFCSFVIGRKMYEIKYILLHSALNFLFRVFFFYNLKTKGNDWTQRISVCNFFSWALLRKCWIFAAAFYFRNSMNPYCHTFKLCQHCCNHPIRPHSNDRNLSNSFFIYQYDQNCLFNTKTKTCTLGTHFGFP